MDGDYSAILNLKRLVGSQVKKYLDVAVDRCSTVTNLREAIYQAHARAETKPHYYQVALNFLERYFYLLMFTQYVLEENKKEENYKFTLTFTSWFNARNEIKNLLANLSLT